MEKLGFIHLSVQDTIEMYELQGMDKETAISKVEGELRVKLPDIIKEELWN